MANEWKPALNGKVTDLSWFIWQLGDCSVCEKQL